MASSASSVQPLAIQSESEKEYGWDEYGNSLTQYDGVSFAAATPSESCQGSSSKSKGKEKEMDVRADVRDPTDTTPETVCKALWF